MELSFQSVRLFILEIEATRCLIIYSEETRQIKLIAQGLPAIKQFVNEELSKSPMSNQTNRIP